MENSYRGPPLLRRVNAMGVVVGRDQALLGNSCSKILPRRHDGGPGIWPSELIGLFSRLPWTHSVQPAPTVGSFRSSPISGNTRRLQTRWQRANAQLRTNPSEFRRPL